METGKVYLVGAGPGDPGLITVRGLECLQHADVVVHDRLADERLLEAVPATAEILYVGKAAGNHTIPQTEINALLVTKASEGKTVVRLKGGDPFVFGRGGEEAQALAENGIPFEVVPGVTSAIAVPACAGIPVTHRGIAASFTVVTGHEAPGKESPGIDWAGLARSTETMVLLMGVKTLPETVAALTRHGRSPDTPVAVINNGTRPDQQTVTGTLENIVAKVSESGLNPPAVVVVGGVVDLRPALRWFDNRPLSGKRVLVTRARRQASRLSRMLSECGALPVELPLIDIRPLADTRELDTAIAGLRYYDWIYFTSVNGVNAVRERLKDLEMDSRALAGIKIGAIGPAPTAALNDIGLVPDHVPETFTTGGILDGLSRRDIRGQRFLLPRADIADDTLDEGLRKLGASVHEITAYHTRAVPEAAEAFKKLLAAGGVDVITFTSSSTVTNLLAVLPDSGLPPDIITACIGPKTAAAARQGGLRADIVATEATVPGLMTALEDYFREASK